MRGLGAWVRSRRGALVLDAAVVAVLTGTTLWHLWIRSDVDGPLWLRVVWPLLIDLPLLLRRRYPLPALTVIATGVVLQALLGADAASGFELAGPVAVAVYSTAAYGSLREAVAGLALLLAAGGVNDARNHEIGTTAQVWADAFWSLLQVAIWLAGRFVRGRRERALLSDRADVLAREAAVAATEERARIARELHDIVSHNLSVVVTQAAGARALAENGGSAPQTLERIEESGRAALHEMRRLLGVLKDGHEATLAPQPGIAQLPALVEGLRDAGVDVELALDERVGNLPPTLDLSVYRIVQEALTNVLRHAEASRVVVTVRRRAGSLEVHVLDDGTPHSGPTAGGHGIAGMRERVSFFGGSLTTAPQPQGGFLVRAELPLEAS